MPIVRPTRHRIALGLLAAAVLTLSACDAAPTAPRRAPLSRIDIAKRALEGDSTKCSRGYIIISGVIVCNDEH